MDDPQKDETAEDPKDTEPDEGNDATEEAEDSESTKTEAEPKKRHGRKFYMMIAAIAAIVVVGGYSGVAYASNDQYGTSVADSKQASEAFVREYDKAQKLVKSVSPKQVADAKTLTALQNELKASKGNTTETPSVSPNGMLVWETSKAKGIQKDYTAKVTNETKKLSSLEGKITGSQLDKAKADLKADITNARNLYNSTEGQVADASTRDTLKKGIDSANKLFSEMKNTGTKEAQQVMKDLHMKSNTPADWIKQFTDAKSKLDAAQKAVSDSQSAKQQSDAAAQVAAQQAQDAQAQQQAQGGSSNTGYAGSYSGGSYAGSNGGYSGGSYSNGGSGYQAPAQHYNAPVPSAPTPSAPSWNGTVDLGDVGGLGGPPTGDHPVWNIQIPTHG